MNKLGKHLLHRDESNTLFQEACGIINSTPLYDTSSNPSGPFPVTPANILTTKDCSSPAPPEKFNESDLLSSGKRRWRRVQFLSDHFWKQWS